MKHWLQLVANPNTPSSSGGPELQSLKKRIADLEKARSRSPRRNAQKQASLGAGPFMFALPAPKGRTCDEEETAEATKDKEKVVRKTSSLS